MKYIIQASAFAFMLLPAVAAAQFGSNEINQFLQGVTAFINETIVPVLLALAFLTFIIGLVRYFLVASDNTEQRTEGRNLMMYGIIGFVAIVSLWGIVTLIAAGLGFSGDTLDTVPPVPGFGS